MMDAKIKNIAIAVLCVVLTICVIVVAARVGRTLTGIEATTVEVRKSAEIARAYVEFQNERLRDPRNQKALEAGWQAPAILNGTLRLINTQTIPRVHRNLEGLEETQVDLRRAVSAIDQLVHNTDIAINKELLPEITATARALNATVESVDKAIRVVTEKSSLTLDEIHALMSDPAWLGTLKNVEQSSAALAKTSESVSVIAANTAKASGELPSIAANLERISTTTSRYTKISLLASIVATLVRAFIR
ncbi:MAG: hypothetical protein L0229_20285 [Blastocatellia bacterium]|nr:hypothetical protein [Blastocatellia bacterium]